ncbi:hypothetical protein BH23CHL2_BH23CHL2_27450 [soil metagenome]
MITSIAILTSNAASGEGLHNVLTGLGSGRVRLVWDEPDFALRSLTSVNVVILLQDVPRERARAVLRGLRRISNRARSLLVVPFGEPADRVLEYLSLGARAILHEHSSAAELVDALPQVVDGNLYISPELVPALLDHYRELCAQVRRTSTSDCHLNEMQPFC